MWSVKSVPPTAGFNCLWFVYEVVEGGIWSFLSQTQINVLEETVCFLMSLRLRVKENNLSFLIKFCNSGFFLDAPMHQCLYQYISINQAMRQTFTRVLTFCHCLGLWVCWQGRAARKHQSGRRHPSDLSSAADAASPPPPQSQTPRRPQVWNSVIQNHLLLLSLSFSFSSFSGLLDY